MRAIAIIMVLVFHSMPNWLPYGFLGVDVFFTISGFLITGLIYRGLENGNFSFAEFYRRRVLRIFPALILVLIAAILLGRFISVTLQEYRYIARCIFCVAPCFIHTSR